MKGGHITVYFFIAEGRLHAFEYNAIGDNVKCAFDVKCKHGALVPASEIGQDAFLNFKNDVLC